MKNRIEIIGLLGAGKTTLLNKISCEQQSDVLCVYEDLSALNEIWDFINKTQRNYFLLQSAYYLEAFDKLLTHTSEQMLISDFSLRVHHFVYSFHLLEQQMINEIEWTMLNKMLAIYSENLPSIKGFLLIEATPDELLANLRERNRNLDFNTSLDDLIKLVDCFNLNKADILQQVPTLFLTVSELRIFNDETQQKLYNFIGDKKISIGSDL